MIAIKTACAVVANAIHADASVRAIADRYAKPLRMLIGISNEAAGEYQDGVSIAVYPSTTQGYDIGHGVPTRNVPLSVRFNLHDSETTETRGGLRFSAMDTADDLAQAIVAAVKAIAGFGDELANAEYTLDTTTTWPNASGQIDMMFVCQRGTNFEPSLTE